MFRALREPDGFKGRCGICEYRQVCGGSRAGLRLPRFLPSRDRGDYSLAERSRLRLPAETCGVRDLLSDAEAAEDSV